MFEGFSKDTFKFFSQLEKNNNRDWFQEHKPWYEEVVLFPAMKFVEDMEKPLKKISPAFTAVAKRSGGSIMRIYRDTRFSKDKTPYKTNLGIHFRHEQGKNVHAPGFYFHIDRKEIFFGAGIWHPESAAIKKIRFLIDDDQKRWKRVTSTKKFKNEFERHGASLKRPPRGFEADHPMIDDLKRKDHIAMTSLSRTDVYDRTLINKVAANMKGCMAYVRFLCDALHLPS
ncbi:MAG: TIGR02453 family protein [Planctomycetota bacterium]